MTGWGLLVGDARQVRAVEFGCLTPRRGDPRARALAALAGQLDALLGRVQPDVVVVETPFAGRFPAAALALAEARGALLVTLGRWGGEVVELEPARVKAAVVGHGRAEKQQVGFVVGRTLGIEGTLSADAADALALALCHLRGSLP